MYFLSNIIWYWIISLMIKFDNELIYITKINIILFIYKILKYYYINNNINTFI